MHRRGFGGRIAAGLVAVGTASAAPAAKPRKNPLMHVGGDYHSVVGGRDADTTSKANLEYNLRHGVKHLTAKIPKMSAEGAWDFDEMQRMRDNCDRHGMTFEAIRMGTEYIAMRPGAERDRRLDNVVDNVRKASHIGVTVITYHWRVIPIRRNREAPGRGGSVYRGFKLEEDWRDLPVGKAGVVSSDDYWERITYFLERVVPVAEEHDVKMACHPYDPPSLPFGYQGAENWDSPDVFDAIKRYEAIVDSPYNGFQLCLGTVGEGLSDPKNGVLPITKYLGENGKIHQIHMRNISGGLHDFLEVFPDEGEMDFLEVIRILRDTQFAGSICPDHMPAHTGDPEKLQAFAFGYGYIRALIQVANAEV